MPKSNPIFDEILAAYPDWRAELFLEIRAAINKAEPATPINFAIWMVLILILAVVVGMFIFQVRSKAKSQSLLGSP